MNILRRGGGVLRPMATDLRAVRRRATLVATVLGFALLGLMYRAWTIAVRRHEHFAELGNRQQLRTYRVDASRGDVVDRDYIALALTDRVFKIVVNPHVLERLRKEDEELLVEMERKFAGRLTFRSDPTFHHEQFVISDAVTGTELKP